MKNTIPFDLFGEQQTIYFDNGRLIEFEKAIGRSLSAPEFLPKAALSLNETIMGLMSGLKHHNPNGTFNFYCNKMDKYYEESGKGFGVAADLVLKAIFATGLYGKAFNDVINGAEKEAEERKNAE